MVALDRAYAEAALVEPAASAATAAGRTSGVGARVAETVIVANRLPAEYHPVTGWRHAPGGLVNALEPALALTHALWVGWGGHPAPEDGQGPAHPPLASDGRIVEIPMSRPEMADHYDGFCNGALWPLYHGSVVPPVFRAHEFAAYQRIDRRFADRVAAIAPPGARIWVNDYHLQLVPAMLRAARPDLRIGFFLHVPFPEPDAFATLPWDGAILDGILGADLVGFQTPESAQRFLATVGRRAGIAVRGDRIEIAGEDGPRTVAVGVHPVGPWAQRFADLADTPRTVQAAECIRADFGHPDLLLLGVDRLDYTQGIDRRIRAVAEVVTRAARDGRDAQFIQVAMPSRTGLPAYRRLRDAVEETLAGVNGELAARGLRPIHYIHEALPVEQVVALYVAADVMVVTPLADGMNLVSKEFVASRTRADGRHVLSSRAGAAVQLRDAWLVDPTDEADIVRGLTAALAAGPEEVAERMIALRRSVFDHDARAWARSFLDDLGGA
ncbi:MAG: trehalose-6-phosphate synthase [Chloroflexota bacterium]